MLPGARNGPLFSELRLCSTGSVRDRKAGVGSGAGRGWCRLFVSNFTPARDNKHSPDGRGHTLSAPAGRARDFGQLAHARRGLVLVRRQNRKQRLRPVGFLAAGWYRSNRGTLRLVSRRRTTVNSWFAGRRCGGSAAGPTRSRWELLGGK